MAKSQRDGAGIMLWAIHPVLADYAVSEYGDVMRVTAARTRRIGHFVKGCPGGNSNEYWRYKLVGPQGKRAYWRHRLVAECFIGPQPTPEHRIAHGDGNSFNSHYKNLRWATPKENGEDTVKHGSLKGVNNGRAILTTQQVQEARAAYTGKYGEQSALARKYGVTSSSMYSILTKEHWPHV